MKAIIKSYFTKRGNYKGRDYVTNYAVVSPKEWENVEVEGEEINVVKISKNYEGDLPKINDYVDLYYNKYKEVYKIKIIDNKIYNDVFGKKK